MVHVAFHLADDLGCFEHTLFLLFISGRAGMDRTCNHFNTAISVFVEASILNAKKPDSGETTASANARFAQERPQVWLYGCEITQWMSLGCMGLPPVGGAGTSALASIDERQCAVTTSERAD